MSDDMSDVIVEDEAVTDVYEPASILSDSLFSARNAEQQQGDPYESGDDGYGEM